MALSHLARLTRLAVPNLAIIAVVADGFEEWQQRWVKETIRGPRRRDTLGDDGEERA